VIVVDSAEKAHSLLAKKSEMPTLEHVVIIDVDKLPTEFSNNTSGVKVSLGEGTIYLA
jgi:hypothetical protein